MCVNWSMATLQLLVMAFLWILHRPLSCMGSWSWPDSELLLYYDKCTELWIVLSCRSNSTKLGVRLLDVHDKIMRQFTDQSWWTHNFSTMSCQSSTRCSWHADNTLHVIGQLDFHPLHFNPIFGNSSGDFVWIQWKSWILPKWQLLVNWFLLFLATCNLLGLMNIFKGFA